MNTNDIEMRVAALERAKRVGTAICALMVVGAATVALRTSQGARSEIVEASKLVVRDEEGRIRAELGVLPDRSVGLVLYDADEVQRVTLAVSNEMPILELQSADERLSATIWVPDVEDGSGVISLEDDLVKVRWMAPYSSAVTRGLALVGYEQELYLGRTGSYAEDISELSLSPPEGVLLEITDASPTGWAGAGAHTAVPGKSCVTYAGTGVEIPTTAGEGRKPEQPVSPVCDRF